MYLRIWDIMLNLTLIACEQGGMTNEMYNVLARVTDEGSAIGGDVYPGSTFSDHVLRITTFHRYVLQPPNCKVLKLV